MTRNRPTGSVTGRAGWEWNRLQTAESATGTTTRTESEQNRQKSTDSTASETRATRTTATEHRCSYRDENIELRKRVQRLETELERRDRHLQSVIDNYERLLADWQTRQRPSSTDDSSTRTADDQLPLILSRLVEYAESR